MAFNTIIPSPLKDKFSTFGKNIKKVSSDIVNAKVIPPESSDGVLPVGPSRSMSDVASNISNDVGGFMQKKVDQFNMEGKTPEQKAQSIEWARKENIKNDMLSDQREKERYAKSLQYDENDDWSTTLNKDLHRFYGGTEKGNIMSSGLYQTLAPHEEEIKNLDLLTQDVGKNIHKVGENIGESMDTAGNYIQGAPDIAKAQKEGKYMTQKEMDEKMDEVMTQIPDITPEELADVFTELKNDGHIFEGINDKHNYEDDAWYDPTTARQLVGGALKTGGQAVGGVTKGYGSLMQASSKMGAGDVSGSAIKALKGTGEAGMGLVAGSMPIANTILNTDIVQQSPIGAGFQKIGQGANWLAGKGAEAMGEDLNTERGRDLQEGMATLGQAVAVPMGLKGMKMAGVKMLPMAEATMNQAGEYAGKIREALPNMPNIPKPNITIPKVEFPKAETILESRLEKTNRIDPSKYGEFQQKSGGQSVGSYLMDNGITGTAEQNIPKLYERYKTSMSEADKGLEAIKGRYELPKEESIEIFDELKGRMKYDKENLPKVLDMEQKNADGGLTMTEANALKRMYEKEVKVGYLKENNSVKTKNSTDIDTNLRNWQMDIAEQNGFGNLREINKQTQLSRFLLDNIESKLKKVSGNNAMSLTDYIMMPGALTNPSIASALIGKKIMGSNFVQGKLQDFLYKKTGKTKNNPEVANLEEINRMQSQKSNQQKNDSNSTVSDNRMNTGADGVAPAPTVLPNSYNIPGARKTTIETPLNPEGNKTGILAGKQGVIVGDSSPTLQLPSRTPSGMKIRQGELQDIKQSLAESTRGRNIGETGMDMIYQKIGNLMDDGKLTEPELAQVLKEIHSEIGTPEGYKYFGVSKAELGELIDSISPKKETLPVPEKAKSEKVLPNKTEKPDDDPFSEMRDEKVETKSLPAKQKTEEEEMMESELERVKRESQNDEGLYGKSLQNAYNKIRSSQNRTGKQETNDKYESIEQNQANKSSFKAFSDATNEYNTRMGTDYSVQEMKDLMDRDYYKGNKSKKSQNN